MSKYECPVDDDCPTKPWTATGVKRHVNRVHPDADWDYEEWLDQPGHEETGRSGLATDG